MQNPESPGADLLAVDPIGLGGAILSNADGETARPWLERLRALLPAGMVVRRLPPGVSDERLSGGIDVAATLANSTRVMDRGLLAEAAGGVLVLPLAERATSAVVSRLIGVLDGSALAVVAIECRGNDEEGCPSALADRLAVHVTADAGAVAEIDRERVVRARALLASVAAPDEAVMELCGRAAAFGISSLRASVFALRVARAHAALRGVRAIDAEDVDVATRLVLLPRALQLPPDHEPPDAADAPSSEARNAAVDSASRSVESLSGGDMVVDVAATTLPEGLLVAGTRRPRRAATAGGRVGAQRSATSRGRQIGIRRGIPARGARLDLLATLRAAAPWQSVRGGRIGSADAGGRGAGEQSRLAIRRDDLRLRRLAEQSGTTVIVVVDASGSAAVHRLAEAKGAVSLLLAASYARRDRVSLITFRGDSADLALPPTRALARAKRLLTALPAGGGTPLAAGLDAAYDVARRALRDGQDVVVVLLTDAHANVGREGRRGREVATVDALSAARRLSDLDLSSVFVDTAPRSHPLTGRLTAALRAKRVTLPAADARRLSGIVREARGHE